MRPGTNEIEKIKAEKDGLDLRQEIRRFGESGWQKIPEADLMHRLKWVGVFFRKPTPGYFMMRIRIPNGFTDAAQLRAIAELAHSVGTDFADITTRQQIQLRGFQIHHVPEMWERLAAVGLNTLQTGMDNVRNINGCPVAGLTPHELFDASPQVFGFTQEIVGNKAYTNLPRKYNVTITGCLENCTHTESQDIGMTPATKVINGQLVKGFHVAIGGKMGSGGYTVAKSLDLFIRPEEAVEMGAHITQIYRDHGPRDNRAKCRLWFLVEEWGIPRYRQELENRCGRPLEREGTDARWKTQVDHVGVFPQRQPGLFYVGVIVPVGRITSGQLMEVARLAQAYADGQLRLTTGQNLIFVNVPEAKLQALLAEPLLKELTPFPSPLMRGLVSCTGIQYCNLAVIETKSRALAITQELERRFGKELLGSVRIHWSGCPAGCGNHQVGDIGLQGTKANVAGKVVDAVQIFVGGRSGTDPRPPERIMDLVPCDEVLPEVLQTIIKHMGLFRQITREPTSKDRILMVPTFAEEGAPASSDSTAHRAEETPKGLPSELQERSSPAGPKVGQEPSSAKVQVCKKQELPEGQGKLLTANGRSLALFRLGERILAIDAQCPHEGGPLQDGRMEQGCVVCPWHGYRFELTRGQCTTEPGLSVRVYPTFVEGEMVWVEVSG